MPPSWLETLRNLYFNGTFFLILVTCGNGNTQASCGECPKPTSDTDVNCVSGDCAVVKFITAFDPLTFKSDPEFFCTSKYLNRFGKIATFFVPKVIIEKSRGEGSLMDQDTVENVS